MIRYWLAIAYRDTEGKGERDAEAFVLAGVPEHGRGWNISSPNSRDLDFLYETYEDCASAKFRFRQHGFAIIRDEELAAP